MKRNEHTIHREIASVPDCYRERGLAAVILYLVCSRYEHGMNILSMETDAAMRRTLRELEADRSIIVLQGEDGEVRPESQAGKRPANHPDPRWARPLRRPRPCLGSKS